MIATLAWTPDVFHAWWIIINACSRIHLTSSVPDARSNISNVYSRLTVSSSCKHYSVVFNYTVILIINLLLLSPFSSTRSTQRFTTWSPHWPSIHHAAQPDCTLLRQYYPPPMDSYITRKYIHLPSHPSGCHCVYVPSPYWQDEYQSLYALIHSGQSE